MGVLPPPALAELPDPPQLGTQQIQSNNPPANISDVRRRFEGAKARANTPTPSPEKPSGQFIRAEVFAVVVTATLAVLVAELLKSTVYWFRESADWIAQVALGAVVLQAR